MNGTTHLEVVIVEDDDHVQHVQSDAQRGWLNNEDAQEELNNLSDGTWTTYGVTTARYCDCCDNVVEEYVTALWGCVVEESNQTGRYAPAGLARIESAHLRDVAQDLLEDAAAQPA